MEVWSVKPKNPLVHRFPVNQLKPESRLIDPLSFLRCSDVLPSSLYSHTNTHHLSLLSRSSQRSRLLRCSALRRVTLCFRDLIVPTSSPLCVSTRCCCCWRLHLATQTHMNVFMGAHVHTNTQMTRGFAERTYQRKNALSAVYVNRVSRHSALMCASVFYKCPLLLSKNTVLPVVHLRSPPSFHPSDRPVLGRAFTWRRK